MKLGAIVFDCKNAEELFHFYQSLLGGNKEIHTINEDHWIALIDIPDFPCSFIFQEEPAYCEPVWPSSADEHQQMMHLDYYVPATQLETLKQRALALGAKVAEGHTHPGWHILLDPAGHPFCLIPVSE